MFQFAANENAMRLDAYLLKLMPEYSRARIQKLIVAGNITVNKKVAKASQKIKLKDEILVTIPEPQKISLEAEAIPLDILYEDQDLLVLNKPAGLVVHPAAGNWKGTLVHALLHHCGNELSIGGELRPGIVHRLDKNTSGVMVVTKTDQAHASLAEQFKIHSITRRYLGLCWGILPLQGQWSEPIARDPKHRQRMAAQPQGKRAITNFVRIKNFKIASYFEAELQTGRTHQIRVHFSHHGFPLVGDATYGQASRKMRVIKEYPQLFTMVEALYEKKRQFLHAQSLDFIHPRTQKKVQFQTNLPQDLQELLQEFEKL